VLVEATRPEVRSTALTERPSIGMRFAESTTWATTPDTLRSSFAAGILSSTETAAPPRSTTNSLAGRLGVLLVTTRSVYRSAGSASSKPLPASLASRTCAGRPGIFDARHAVTRATTSRPSASSTRPRTAKSGGSRSWTSDARETPSISIGTCETCDGGTSSTIHVCPVGPATPAPDALGFASEHASTAAHRRPPITRM
jgi:hypothetical protein